MNKPFLIKEGHSFVDAQMTDTVVCVNCSQRRTTGGPVIMILDRPTLTFRKIEVKDLTCAIETEYAEEEPAFKLNEK